MKKSKLRILNPKNLQKEIHLYGYDFDMKSYVLTLVAIFFAAIILGKGLLLENKYIGLIVCGFLIAAPFFVRNLFHIMYEQKRFLNAKSYMENMLYAFIKRDGKILATLEDVLSLYEESEFRELIGYAAAYIRKGQYERNLYKEAFSSMEALYSNKRIRAVHDFMIMVENTGGEFKNAAQMLIMDNNEWEYNVSALQQAKKAKLQEIYGAVIMGVAVCITILFMQKYYMPSEMSIAHLFVVQLTSTLLILAELFLVVFAQSRLNTDWLSREIEEPWHKVSRDYHYIAEYNNGIQKIFSIFWALPFFAGGVVMWIIYGKKYLALILILIGCLMLNQHKLGYQIVYKRNLERIKIAFPQWITRLSLLLQTNNVQVALGKSLETAPVVLIPELEHLMKRISETPGDVNAYLDFMKQYSQPDIRTAMQILYSISETGNGDAGLQLDSLSSTNISLKNEAEKIRNKAILSDMELMVNCPLGIAAAAQFVYLAVFMQHSMLAMTRLYM